MPHRVRSILAVLIAASATLLSAQDTQSSAPASQPEKPALPAPLSGFADEGTFNLYKDEDRLAVITFKLTADGALRSKSVLSMAGQTVESELEIPAAPDGLWDRMEMKTALGPVSVVREGGDIKITFKEKTTTIKLAPDTVLFENFSPVLMSQAIRRYDRAKAGKQALQLFIVPNVCMAASLELTGSEERSVGGRDYKLDKYTYGLPGVDVVVWADADGRVYLGDVPAQHAAYVRAGFESLRTAPQSDPTLSQPTFEVTEEPGVLVPMRDGVKLATDVYRPAADGKFPGILIRTPYKKEMSGLQGRYFARRGYVCAIQDVRGRFASEGEWEPFLNEKQDGYDAVEWLAAQRWSSGKVGMIGASYLGWVQWLAATQNPPHLVTIIPNVAPPDPFRNIPYENGVFFLWGAIWWADVVEREATADLSGRAMSDIMDKNYDQLLRALPVIDLDKAVLGHENKYWRLWIEHNTDDAFWKRGSHLAELKNVRIPVFHQSGWFDGDGIGSKLNYAAMASHGHPGQKLVLGPWGHSPEAHRGVGENDFGPEAIIDLPRDYLRWFDHWLKGVDNGIDREPLVSLFVMRENKWLHGDKYPLPQTKFEKAYFVTPGGAANTSGGDGKLTREPPPADGPPARYTYDPADPTPIPYHDFSGADERKEKSAEEERAKAKERPKQILASRRDILVFQTEPLERSLTLCGPISAKLYAASTARDTDWFVRLVEVDKDGDPFPLVEGRLRARFRGSMSQPELLEPGKVYEFDVDMWQTGIKIRPGCRLRVEVASASFPFFSRNLNTGGHNEKDTEFVKAEQTIYCDAQRPSHVLLPVIPTDGDEASKQE